MKAVIMSKHLPLLKVKPLAGYRLHCTFEGNAERVYDFTPHLTRRMFQPLQNEFIFKTAHADPHGLGVVWNDDMDIAASEIWLNGESV
jgi:hypothetical protein